MRRRTRLNVPSPTISLFRTQIIFFLNQLQKIEFYESTISSNYFDIFWKLVQVILFEIDCEIVYTNLQELFCQFISWTNWVNSGKFMDNCWISCQVIADMKNVYNHLIIINLYIQYTVKWSTNYRFCPCFSWCLVLPRSELMFAKNIWP